MSLIDPSVPGLAAAGLPGSLLSFGMPCLKWKLAAAFKTHWGFDGYDSTISPPNKYLTKTVVYTVINTFAGQSGTGITNSVITIDRMSGVVSGNAPDGEGPIGGGAPIVYSGDTVKTTDTGVVVTGSNATTRQIWQVTLSNQYTLAALEADVDALLAGFNPDVVPINTITPLAYSADGNPTAGEFATILVPAPYNYPHLLTPTMGSPMSQPTLGAAAISAYNPNLFVQDFGTSGMGKVEGFISMAGDYCLKTYSIDPAGQFIGSPTCVSGRGSCSSWFKVTPPAPYVPGQNTYVLAVPNCQCGNG
ncbi:MAG TPA: hypothetical protein VN048_13025 [Verrucomicrobiae bacterium]|nr:hypothetical protein [Verrucomicrobiae bacterium]